MTFGNDANGNDLVIKQALMKMSCQTLIENCKSGPFKPILAGPFIEGRNDTITLEEDTSVGVELWLHVFHGAFNDDSYSLSIEEMWNAIGCGRKYLFQMSTLR